MSVLIRGMEMPQNCDKCRFQSALRLYCDAMPYNFCGNTDDIERPNWCPLVEIPTPHGNLKDESDIISLIEVMFCKDKDGMEHAIQCVKDAPTVIEAEGEIE